MEGIEYKIKDEIRDHLPEWIRILQDYFRDGYKNYMTNKSEYKKPDYRL